MFSRTLILLHFNLVISHLLLTTMTIDFEFSLYYSLIRLRNSTESTSYGF